MSIRIFKVHYLVECILIVENHVTRNEIALVLSDLRYSKAVSNIIKLIKDPKTLGNRGTLLYALEGLEYVEYLEDIIDLLDAEHFEIRAQSYILLQKAIDILSKEKRHQYHEKLTKKLEDAYKKLEFLEDAIDMIKRHQRKYDVIIE